MYAAPCFAIVYCLLLGWLLHGIIYYKLAHTAVLILFELICRLFLILFGVLAPADQWSRRRYRAVSDITVNLRHELSHAATAAQPPARPPARPGSNCNGKWKCRGERE
jgi:hypothetical protein